MHISIPDVDILMSNNAQSCGPSELLDEELDDELLDDEELEDELLELLDDEELLDELDDELLEEEELEEEELELELLDEELDDELLEDELEDDELELLLELLELELLTSGHAGITIISATGATISPTEQNKLIITISHWGTFLRQLFSTIDYSHILHNMGNRFYLLIVHIQNNLYNDS